MPTVVPGVGASVLASDLITRSARTLGYLGRTEVLSAGDANDGLNCLNAMLDSWSGEGLASWATNQQQFILTPGKQQYTIGTVGTPDVNNTRPIDITQAFIRGTNNLDYNMNVIPQTQWDNIGFKSITSQIPNTLFYDSQEPLGIINIFPIPLLAYTLFYSAVLQQNMFALLTTQLAAPPGYTRAYILNLALEMQTAGFPCMLKGDDMLQLRANAAEAKANIKRSNIKEELSEYDPYIVSNSYATYNIYSDGLPRR